MFFVVCFKHIFCAVFLLDSFFLHFTPVFLTHLTQFSAFFLDHYFSSFFANSLWGSKRRGKEQMFIEEKKEEEIKVCT
jgi:hypothetical protein